MVSHHTRRGARLQRGEGVAARLVSSRRGEAVEAQRGVGGGGGGGGGGGQRRQRLGWWAPAGRCLSRPGPCLGPAWLSVWLFGCLSLSIFGCLSLSIWSLSIWLSTKFRGVVARVAIDLAAGSCSEIRRISPNSKAAARAWSSHPRVGVSPASGRRESGGASEGTSQENGGSGPSLTGPRRGAWLPCLSRWNNTSYRCSVERKPWSGSAPRGGERADRTRAPAKSPVLQQLFFRYWPCSLLG
eukprot:SAG22_NODE_5764_length_956_cov_1.759627_1_plen_241_part_10